MEATLQALVDLLIKSVPTIVFFIFLTFYLNAVFFRPVSKILEERRRQTEGVREFAQKAFEAADKKTSEFQRAIQAARAEINADNDALRKKWSEEQAQALASARVDMEKKIKEAKLAISDEVEHAKSELDMNVESLSTRIVESVTRRRVA